MKRFGLPIVLTAGYVAVLLLVFSSDVFRKSEFLLASEFIGEEEFQKDTTDSTVVLRGVEEGDVHSIPDGHSPEGADQ